MAPRRKKISDHPAKKEIMKLVMERLEQAVEDWLRGSDLRRSLIITLEKGKAGIEAHEIKYVCASLVEVEERGLMEEYKKGRVIISVCC